uniref:Uncharacterized protein n=1 Tax=Plectus sambesii TaxID=2011161 RepID=A0A914WHW9_9BILA
MSGRSASFFSRRRLVCVHLDRALCGRSRKVARDINLDTPAWPAGAPLLSRPCRISFGHDSLSNRASRPIKAHGTSPLFSAAGRCLLLCCFSVRKRHRLESFASQNQTVAAGRESRTPMASTGVMASVVHRGGHIKQTTVLSACVDRWVLSDLAGDQWGGDVTDQRSINAKRFDLCHRSRPPHDRRQFVIALLKRRKDVVIGAERNDLSVGKLSALTGPAGGPGSNCPAISSHTTPSVARRSSRLNTIQMRSEIMRRLSGPRTAALQ